VTGGGTTSGDPPDPGAGVLAAAARAAELVENGDWIGLGTGRAASAFVAALGERVRAGLAVVGVATSKASALKARAEGIPLADLADLADRGELALTVDGADEVAPNLDLIKGRGGALVRERIVAAASRRQVIVIGIEKLVAALGERGDVPVEIVPMARGLVARRLRSLALRSTLRPASGGGPGGEPFVTDNGNLILDVGLAAPLGDARAARALAAAIREIPGVVDLGLFLGTAERVLAGHPDGQVDVLLAAPAARAPHPGPLPGGPGRG
jgi:ribose 5-phosphate isomerase A